MNKATTNHFTRAFGNAMLAAGFSQHSYFFRVFQVVYRCVYCFVLACNWINLSPRS